MKEFFEFLSQSGFLGWCIVATGVAGFALVIERSKMLYFSYSLKSEDFMKHISQLIISKRVEEAVVVCTQLEHKPLASAFKTILQKADRDDDTIFQAHDIALAETAPLYTRRLHYLGMIANVATLVGLLGTIHGLILSFQAVASADPSLKQELLAKGISVSMYDTMLGLAVAIPAMVLFSFLTARQNHLLEELQEKTTKLTELLTSSHAPSLLKETVFPDIPVAHSSIPPLNHVKVS